MDDKRRLRMYILAKIEKIENRQKFFEDNLIKCQMLEEEIELKVLVDIYRFLNSM